MEVEVLHLDFEFVSLSVRFVDDLYLGCDSEVGKLVSHQQGLVTALDHSKEIRVLLGHRADFEESLLLEEFKSVEIRKCNNRTVSFLQVPD